MKNKNTYAVFGLGRYGMAVAKELVKGGSDVIAIDFDEKNVNDAVDVIPVCKCGNVTDIDVLYQLGIDNVDTVIIAMASDLESTVMAITLCKEIGVPNVIAKCGSEMHKKILEKVGADKVMFPEDESGTRLAKNLMNPNVSDIFALSENSSIVELKTPKDWCGKTLVELGLRKKYSINIIAIKNGSDVIIDINPNMPLTQDMVLIVIANSEKIQKLKNKL